MSFESFMSDVFQPSHQKEQQGDNPYETEEYQKFVESMIPHCRCEFDCPCDGVLAGGICDQKKERE